MRPRAIAAAIVVYAVCAAAEPPPPTLVFPSDRGVIGHLDPAAGVTPFVWKAVPGAVRYRLMLDFGRRFDRPLYDHSVSETTPMLTGLEVGRYYWQVAAIDAEGVQGPFSERSTFRVDRVSADARPSGMVGRSSTDGPPPTETIDVGGGYSVLGVRLFTLLHRIREQELKRAPMTESVSECRETGRAALLAKDGGLIKDMQQRVDLYSTGDAAPTGNLFVTRLGDANVVELRRPNGCLHYVQQYVNGAPTLIEFSALHLTEPGLKERLGTAVFALVAESRGLESTCGLSFDSAGILKWIRSVNSQ
jgi:hypothetical protein